MGELQRLTTEYIEEEDRIRISGALATDETVVMWLSQRLLLRLLPHLFLWLERQSGDSIPVEIVQSFAQEAAKAELTRETPVQWHSGSQEWLVYAVDITPISNAVTMRLRSNNGQQEQLTMLSQQLRQWLEVLNSLWGVAEWPNSVWPNWLSAKAKQLHQSNVKQLH